LELVAAGLLSWFYFLYPCVENNEKFFHDTCKTPAC